MLFSCRWGVIVAVLTVPVVSFSQSWNGFAGNAQHWAQSTIPSRALDKIVWQTPVDTNPPYSGSELFIHYGSPICTSNDTIVIPVRTGSPSQFVVSAFDGDTGTKKWSYATRYSLPFNTGWIPSCNATLVTAPSLGSNAAVAWPESGGRIAFKRNADAATPAPFSVAFFGTGNYLAHPSEYDRNVQICTPPTAGPDGSVYFGYTVIGPTRLRLKSGIARVTPTGAGAYSYASTLSTDATCSEIQTNSAPALSVDGRYLYTVVHQPGDWTTGYVVKLDAKSLKPIASAQLIDPKSGAPAAVLDLSTASPMVGPDGDVYVGVIENPFPDNNDRGWMLHFSGDLKTKKIPGAFGWDNTASVVPASACPFYKGTSSYLIFTKYNNYDGIGTGNGNNEIGILDPNVSETDPVSGATTMNEVGTQVGQTPTGTGNPTPVHEWCINSGVVDIPGKCILSGSEDGILYRWDMVTNTLSEKITLTGGLGEAYTMTVIGNNGCVYAISNAILFCVGSKAR